MSNRDYVVQTHPCSEVIAKSNLEARGFEVYFPTVIEEIRTGHRREKRTTVMAPLFPGYVFVRLDLRRGGWREIASVKGVKKLLGCDVEHPAPLPDRALDDLRARFAAGEFVKRVTTFKVNAGEAVTVTQGAFEGHTGICTMSRGERIKVLLNRLSGAVQVEMPVAMVAGAR